MKRGVVLFTVLSLLLLVLLPACGRGEEEETSIPTPIQTTTVSPTATPTITTDITTTPASTTPVKIGAIYTWSGPMAMGGLLTDKAIAVVERQLKNKGGILGGREVKFIRGDDGGVVAQSAAQAKKLVLEDKVAILTLGGITVSSESAVSDVAEELKVPYVAFANVFNLKDKKYTVVPLGSEAIMIPPVQFIIDVLKPKTMAWLAPDIEEVRRSWDGFEGIMGWGDRLKAAGIDVVYKEYFPMSTQDYSPYLTKIKYANPEVLAVYLGELSQAVTINRQIMELGGWGSIKFFGATAISGTAGAVKLQSAIGSYVTVNWLPGSDEPGMKAFEDAFRQVHDQTPTFEITFTYNALWIAIKAIELAGTDDPGKVAEALRSGDLEVDSAWGPLRIGSDGKGEVPVMVAQVQEGGKMVPVWTWYPK